VPNFIKIGQTVAVYGDLTVFLNGGRPPFWVCWAPTGTTHDDFLLVSPVIINVVVNRAAKDMQATCILSCLAPTNALVGCWAREQCMVHSHPVTRYDAQTYVQTSTVRFSWRIDTRTNARLPRPTFLSYRGHGCIHSKHNGSMPR